MITESDQNYLKEIYLLELDHAQVTTSMLAELFGFSPATVTGMLKKLASRGWVKYEPYQGVVLTDSGRLIAMEVIRHHRLIESFLAKTLHVPWDRVHDEAEKLEHVLSDYLEERIDDLLGHPTFDPHGSPIPSRDGAITRTTRKRLADLKQGAQAEIIEVYDRDPEVLERLDRLGLHPGTRVVVLEVEPVDGLITLKAAGGEPVVLGQTIAGRVFVGERASLPESMTS